MSNSATTHTGICLPNLRELVDATISVLSTHLATPAKMGWSATDSAPQSKSHALHLRGLTFRARHPAGDSRRPTLRSKKTDRWPFA
jgi:hypothetical protein